MSNADCAPANLREDALAFAEAAAALVTPDAASRVTSNLVELLRTLDRISQEAESRGEAVLWTEDALALRKTLSRFAAWEASGAWEVLAEATGLLVALRELLTAERLTAYAHALTFFLRTLDDLAQYGASDALARLRDAYALAREDLEARPHPPSIWEIFRLLGDPYVRTKIWLILRTLRGV
ncbi:hypothetical protein [Brockia lithotrophica]|uniref:Uncharacterized protein n=1 Tax=Brockia lithotrophica TaxID=933949 RepID=A0A660L3P6_9BACL|nr:hypothetical protein [Brockia lithotrophica]RKQ88641.1 hypothetical protein C7438_0280 [Brockia lithotrophica]